MNDTEAYTLGVGITFLIVFPILVIASVFNFGWLYGASLGVIASYFTARLIACLWPLLFFAAFVVVFLFLISLKHQ